jgi:hypothetical protein
MRDGPVGPPQRIRCLRMQSGALCNRACQAVSSEFRIWWHPHRIRTCDRRIRSLSFVSDVSGGQPESARGRQTRALRTNPGVMPDGQLTTGLDHGLAGNRKCVTLTRASAPRRALRRPRSPWASSRLGRRRRSSRHVSRGRSSSGIWISPAPAFVMRSAMITVDGIGVTGDKENGRIPGYAA